MSFCREILLSQDVQREAGAMDLQELSCSSKEGGPQAHRAVKCRMSTFVHLVSAKRLNIST
ncbi:MAG: hypothetical protein ACXADL_03535 [Candidatus Thorarchaeota archaeon]|jgi:hypothetical protein